MSSAFLQCASMRKASVLIPRNTSQQSIGPAIAPVCTIMSCSGFASSLVLTATMPINTSECPQRYLVAEWNTMSQPISKGCCRCGVAKVLSIPTNAPAAWALAASALMSTSRKSGLDGVSSQTSFTLCAASSSSKRSGLPKSAKTTFTPHSLYTSTNKSYAPP